MIKRRTCIYCIVTILFFAAAAAPARALQFDFEGIGVFRDILWLGNSETDSAPSPILGIWGAEARFHLDGPFWFTPEIGIYGMEYFYENGKAYPAEIEYKDAVGTLCLLLDPLVTYQYSLDEKSRFLLGVGAGPALSIKIPLIPHGSDPSGDVAGYFFGSARFLYFELKTYLDWNITETLALTVRLRTLLPVFHLWDGEGAPFYDQLMAGGGVGLRLKF